MTVLTMTQQQFSISDQTLAMISGITVREAMIYSHIDNSATARKKAKFAVDSYLAKCLFRRTSCHRTSVLVFVWPAVFRASSWRPAVSRGIARPQEKNEY
jgi:hypothetical protein